MRPLLRCPTLLAFLLAALPAAAQGWRQPTTPSGRHELEIRGRVEELSVAPDGSVWMGSAMGELFTADSLEADWRAVIRAPSSDLAELMRRPHFSRVTFLGGDTALVTGYIGREGESLKTDVLLRTTDRGATWESVAIGEDLWVYDVFVDAGGTVWMGGSAPVLLRSVDRGATWRVAGRPVDGRVHRIFIDSAGVGLIGALHNVMAWTRDGGATWARVPTPLDQGRLPAVKDDEDRRDFRIDEVAVYGEHLLALQEGRVFASPRTRVQWRQLPGLVSFAVGREGRTAFAVDTALRIQHLEPDLRLRPASGERLNAPAGHLEVHAGRLYAMDTEGGLYRFGGERPVYTFPLSAGPITEPMAHVRRQGGVLWAATAHHLYRGTREGGWSRVAAIPFSVAGILMRDSARAFVWDGHGANAEVDLRSGSVNEVQPLRGYDLVRVLDDGRRWVGFGGRQWETAMRVEVAQTFHSGQFRGSRDDGFVVVSEDRGKSWRVAAEWPGTGVASVFVHPNGGLTLLSYLGAVRQVTPDGRAETVLEATAGNTRQVPYVQTVGALVFHDARRGFVEGWIHHVGDKRFQTEDGGRSWREVPRLPRHFSALIPTRGGWLGAGADELYLLADGVERRLFDGREAAGKNVYRSDEFEYPLPSLLDLSVAENGDAIVQLWDRSIWAVPLAGEPYRLRSP